MIDTNEGGLKMSFKEVQDLDCDNATPIGGFNKKTKKDNPKMVEGYYLGSREVPDQKRKSGISYLHILQTAKGRLGIWGKTDMDRKIRAVTPGVVVRITFLKMVPTPNGEMYKYSVELDEENVLDMSDFAPSDAAAVGEDDDVEETQDDEVVDEEEPIEEVDAEEEAQPDEAPYVAPKAPPRKPQPPTADAQKKVRD